LILSITPTAAGGRIARKEGSVLSGLNPEKWETCHGKGAKEKHPRQEMMMA
jgi:hypothetical protein